MAEYQPGLQLWALPYLGFNALFVIAVAFHGRHGSVMSNALADALERPSTQSDKTVGIEKMKLQHSNMSLSHGILESFQQ